MAEPGKPRVDKRQFNAGRVLAAGGAVAVLGSFQTWVTARAGSHSATIQTIAVKGTAAGHNGNVTLILGVVIMVIAAVRLLRPVIPRWPVVAAAGLAVIILLATAADLSDLGDRTVKGFRYTYSAGIGMFLELLAAVVVLAGAGLALRPGATGSPRPDA